VILRDIIPLRSDDVKKLDLIREVEKLGWYFDNGSKHDKMSHKEVGHKLIIPRHKEINEATARYIIENAKKYLK
jgi:predicted RNA binding protein YcfA (HicA-like mRNA interferase family)